MSTQYSFTTADVDAAFETLNDTLFNTIRDANCADCTPCPKILIVAGAQGSGKTFLLDNTLLPSGRYADYIRLYLPEFRELHPRYAEMSEHGVLHVYEHTEAFIWALGNKVFAHAFGNRYNIIMETALDDLAFAAFPPSAVAAGYQFEVHVIACQKEFSHWATLDRGVKSIAKHEFERFLPLTKIEASQNNARAILDAFENACIQVPGSQITLYHRGIETDYVSKALCHSRCESPAVLTPQAQFEGQPFVQLSQVNPSFEIRRNSQANFPCSFLQYALVVHAGMIDAEVRQKMLGICCKTLGKAQELLPRVPSEVFRELSLYVLKYGHP